MSLAQNEESQQFCREKYSANLSGAATKLLEILRRASEGGIYRVCSCVLGVCVL